MRVRLQSPIRFPSLCPGCGWEADSIRTLVYRRSSSRWEWLRFAVAGEARYEKHTLSVPYCSRCNRRFWASRLAIFLLIVLLGGASFAVLLSGQAPTLPAGLRLVVGLGSLALLLSPLFWFLARDLLSDISIRRVDPATGDLELVLASEPYARALEEANSPRSRAVPSGASVGRGRPRPGGLPG